MAAPQSTPVKLCNRWTRKSKSSATLDHVSDESSTSVPPPHPQFERRPKAATCPSYILKHYHSTGCSGGAFSWRAAMMDAKKQLYLCTEPREYRKTTMQDIKVSLEDKRRGGGPRVGPFQECIPGREWHALPKYDFTTRNRSSAFNERMHVEWENHVDHILQNGGKLPVASVVAKAGFRSCAPCCRDMLALARPTGKTFIMVDLAEDDARGTFHFVTGDRYLPVPKEACNHAEITALKKIVAGAQNNLYASSDAIYNAVMNLEVPVDEVAQAMYMEDKALLPSGCAKNLSGADLLDVLHAEHFARLPAEYGASILRDRTRSQTEKNAIEDCRNRAKQLLIAAWGPHIQGINLEKYAAAAVAPLFTEDPDEYENLRRSIRVRAPRLTEDKLCIIQENQETLAFAASTSKKKSVGSSQDDGNISISGQSTAVPDDTASSCDIDENSA